MSPKVVTASELARAEICERQIILDRIMGARRSAEVEERIEIGNETHRALHISAVEQLQAGDKRCMVATSLWGADAPETVVLREWRDRRLKPFWIGRLLIVLYYRISPSMVTIMKRVPAIQSVLRKMILYLIKMVGEMK